MRSHAIPRHRPDPEARRERLVADAATRFGVAPGDVRVVRAPYRLCPLGAHLDHDWGWVATLALEQALLLAWVPDPGGRMTLASRDYAESITFDVADPETATGDWGDYARGAAAVLGAEAPLAVGVRGLVDGPLAESGLSSSAAVGVAWLTALAQANERPLDAEGLVRAQGRIEQGWLELSNGLTDPAAVVLGRRGALSRIDTRTLAVRRSVGAEHLAFVAFSSGQQAALRASGAFNARVQECRDAARAIAGAAGIEPGDPPRLGALPRELVEDSLGALPEAARRKARHFLTETARVDAGMAAWAAGDAARFGELMNASARSSVDDYGTGSPVMLDLLAVMQSHPGVHGARFSGGGHRGCCVALVDLDAAETVIDEVGRAYATRRPDFAARAWALVSRPADGAGPA